MKHLLRYTLIFLFIPFSHAQSAIPFSIENNSTYADDELYVAIVGQDLSIDRAHVWVDLTNGNQMPMDPSYNTIDGPVYDGNLGPGANGKYANCFFKLSDIPNKEVLLSPIQGCRMFIAAEEQLYLYFFGSTGAQVGYASPSHSNPTDPSQGIIYEIIELTYNEYGFWGNTSRVDSYNYSMGLELTGGNNETIRTGELLSQADVVSQFLAAVPVEFQGCYDSHTGQIFQPTKTEDFADGTIGTMPNPGPYKDYMKPYIDEIWDKFKTEDLIFNHPEIGTWSGRVNGSDEFVFTCTGGPAGFIGETGIIPGRPSTQEAFEGKGVLDYAYQANPRFDLIMQSQVCAALTRHVIQTDEPNGTVQFWGNPAEFYQESPCNHYAKFWHQQGVRVNQLAYGFAYDDVHEQSSTLHSPSPTAINAVFGGFYEPNVSGITDSESSVISVYPNPAAEVLHVYTASGISEGWVIYNGKGSIIKEGNSSEIAVADLKTGTYFIQLKRDESVTLSFNVAH